MYFDEKGINNTEKCVGLALQVARERNIKNIVVATTVGDTPKLLKEEKDLNIVCVTHAYGFKEAGENELSDEIRKELEDSGIKVLSTGHALSGAERGISGKYGGINPVQLIADSLRMLGQGTKVCVEIGTMALDAGLIPYGEEIIAIAGSSRGADTALIMTPAYSSKILETKINEVICKPRNF